MDDVVVVAACRGGGSRFSVCFNRAGNLDAGAGPWTVGITRLAGVPVVLVLVGDLGRAGGGVTDK